MSDSCILTVFAPVFIAELCPRHSGIKTTIPKVLDTIRCKSGSDINKPPPTVVAI